MNDNKESTVGAKTHQGYHNPSLAIHKYEKNGNHWGDNLSGLILGIRENFIVAHNMVINVTFINVRSVQTSVKVQVGGDARFSLCAG